MTNNTLHGMVQVAYEATAPATGPSPGSGLSGGSGLGFSEPTSKAAGKTLMACLMTCGLGASAVIGSYTNASALPI